MSLPLQSEPFSAEKTRNYFDGLLPEGFTRRRVAQFLRADENDYLSILAGLGGECLGALQVLEEGDPPVSPAYQKLSLKEVQTLAAEGTTVSAEWVTKAHLSLTGASGKVGLYRGQDGTWYLPEGTAPSTHIVKQSHVRLARIVANEQLCMQTAFRLGIEVPESLIVNVGKGGDEDILFASQRYDRTLEGSKRMLNGMPVPFRLHQEDMGQALGISASEKYESRQGHYYARMCSLLRHYSSSPIEDLNKLWQTLLFNYFIGNTDAHIKNISLLYNKELSGLRLAPSYDLVSTVVYAASTRDMAMWIGEDLSLDHIHRASFAQAAKEAGLNVSHAMDQLERMGQAFPSALEASARELSQKKIPGARDLQKKILARGGYAVWKQENQKQKKGVNPIN